MRVSDIQLKAVIDYSVTPSPGDQIPPGVMLKLALDLRDARNELVLLRENSPTGWVCANCGGSNSPHMPVCGWCRPKGSEPHPFAPNPLDPDYPDNSRDA